MYSIKKEDISYTLDGITYYFSTETRRTRFIKRIDENRKAVSAALTKRYKFPIQNDRMADIYLYRTVEPIGFYVEHEGRCYEWPEALKLDGEKVTRTPYANSFPDSMPR